MPLANWRIDIDINTCVTPANTGSSGNGEPVLPRYERIAFEKSPVAPQGEPLAAFVCPGHPLLDSVIDLTLECNRDLLKRGTGLVDERDSGTQPRVLLAQLSPLPPAVLGGVLVVPVDLTRP